MRTNKELKKIFAELNQIKDELDNLKSNPLLSDEERESLLVDLTPVLSNIVDRYDRIDRVWARDVLVNDIDALMVNIFGRYNAEEPSLSVKGLYQDVKESVASAIARRGIRSSMEIFTSNLDVMDEKAQRIESSNNNLVSYINNPNNGSEARLVRAASKAGALLGIAGLGGAVFVAVYQGEMLKNLNAQHESLQNQYSIVEKESQEHYEARKEWEQNAKEWEQQAGEWYNKYNALLQNGGNSGISQEEYNKLKTECDQWKSKYNNLNNSYNAVLAKYDAIMDVIPEGTNAVTYITGLVEDVRKLNAEISVLESRIAGLESSKVTLENKVKDLAAQLDAALKNHSDQQLINTLKQQLEEAATRYGELQATYNKAVQEHNAKVVEYETKINGLESSLKVANDKNNTLQNENNSLKNENAELKAVAQKIGETYLKLYPNGKETGAGNQFNAILTYYAKQPDGINLARDFLVKFIAEVKGVPQSQIARLSDADLVAMADSLVGLPSAPSQNPNGNVHENGSANKGNSGSNQEQDKGDGTGNVTPDLPPARE